MAARIFLYFIALVIVLVLAAGVAWNVFQDEILELALVPDEPVEMLETVETQAYANQAMWLARPDIDNPASDWLPDGLESAESATQPIPVFYVLPTTYLARDRWNAPLNSPAARQRQDLFAASQASIFNSVGEIWAPLYRQAVIGAFLTDHSNAEVALRFAYQDVESAFDYFLSQIGEDQAFVIAGHSQGSLHLTTLLHERIAGTEVAGRIVAAYIIGWPISVETDLPALPLPACAAANDTGCIIAFQSFAEPAEPRQVIRIYDESTGYTGASRRDTAMLCVNPLSGQRNGVAEATDNLGSLIPNAEANGADLVAGLVAARCDERGLLLIGAALDDYDRYILPGNNFHVFDYMLFWANLRQDVARRTAQFAEREQ